MDVILFADRKGQELLPLTDDTCVPLLPLAGKMLIEHTLEALVAGGLRQAHIILSPFAEQVKAALGTGERWGMTLSYSTSRGEESPWEELARLPFTPSLPFLALRGDVARSGQCATFLAAAEAINAPCVHALFGGEWAYMMLCRVTQHHGLESLNWTAGLPSGAATVELDGSVARVDSLLAFHKVNLDAAAGRFAHLLIPGRQTALGLTQGRNTEAYPQNLKQGIALIGSQCHLHPSVELSGEVVIGDSVIIDRRVSIEASVVLPHTYIGEWVELRNAIVRGNDLIRVDHGSQLKISDAFLLADLKTTPFNKGLGTVFNRGAGLFVLLLSLPLWLLAFIMALRQSPGTLFTAYPLRGNKIALSDYGMPQRTEFTALEWNVNAPVLRHLPRLLAVVSGDLTLVGTLPINLEAASLRTEDWEKLADQAPSGLVGPTQLHVPVDAPEEEKLMSDSFYAAHFNFRQDMRYLLQAMLALLSRKAWFPEPPATH